MGNVSEEQQESYAKEQLGVKAGEMKMLGMAWNKIDDTFGITFPEPFEQVTKRGILRSLASVFDPLGLVSPVTLTGKFIYQDACDQTLPWDTLATRKSSEKVEKMEKRVTRNDRSTKEPVLFSRTN